MKQWLDAIRERWQWLILSIKLARMTPAERQAFEARLTEALLFEFTRKYSPLQKSRIPTKMFHIPYHIPTEGDK